MKDWNGLDARGRLRRAALAWGLVLPAIAAVAGAAAIMAIFMLPRFSEEFRQLLGL